MCRRSSAARTGFMTQRALMRAASSAIRAIACQEEDRDGADRIRPASDRRAIYSLCLSLRSMSMADHRYQYSRAVLADRSNQNSAVAVFRQGSDLPHAERRCVGESPCHRSIFASLSRERAGAGKALSVRLPIQQLFAGPCCRRSKPPSLLLALTRARNNLALFVYTVSGFSRLFSSLFQLLPRTAKRFLSQRRKPLLADSLHP
jgi:hypothetical protein